MKQNQLMNVFLIMIATITTWSSCNFRSSEKIRDEFPLPLNLKAVYWGSDVQYPILGLVIQDDLNFVIVAKKDKFLVNRDTVEVEKITRLGIEEHKLLIEVLDTHGSTFFIECSKNSKVTKHNLSLITFDNINNLDVSNIRWVGSDEILEKLR